jgi:cysteinyl-tRNA synthetase
MIKVYNTQTRSKQELVPLEPGRIRMYVCGPTVYNYIHIGNARTFVSFDMIRRYLVWRGLDVTFVQNVTDVDDKIIKKANEEHCSASDVAATYTKAFIDDMHAMGVLDPDVRPRATTEIPAMIDLVQRLIDTDHAYVSEGDVYFSVRSFAEYGKLSHRNIDDMESGHRDLRADGVAGMDERKHDSLDFAVWKAAKPGEPSWDSPWGAGRPGWHIECSAMSKKYLGLPFDIHGGGADLVFPHHENEIAQSEAAYGTTFTNYWLHSGMLRINSEKMSKSLGNFLLLRDVLATTSPDVLRMLMMQTHYRSPLDFSQDRLDEAAAALGRITSLIERINWLDAHASSAVAVLDSADIQARCKALRSSFVEAMDDDFNTAAALGAIFGFVSEINTLLSDVEPSQNDHASLIAVRDLIVELMGVFGIDAGASSDDNAYPVEVVACAAEVAGYEGDNPQAAVDALLACRADARAHKDFALSDRVRDELGKLGFKIEDTAQGAHVTFEG